MASATPKPRRSCAWFSEKLRRRSRMAAGATGPHCNSSDFFRMRLKAENAALWLDADVLLLKPVEIDPANRFSPGRRPRPARQFGALSAPADPIVARSKI